MVSYEVFYKQQSVSEIGLILIWEIGYKWERGHIQLGSMRTKTEPLLKHVLLGIPDSGQNPKTKQFCR